MSKVYRTGIVSVFMLIGIFLNVVQAQTVVRVLDTSGHSIVVEIAAQELISQPDQIILVYDSSVITYEASTAFPVKNRIEEEQYSPELFKKKNFISNVLAVEIEKDIEIEDWMLSPFKLENTTEYLKPVKEEEIMLETWMTDLNQWK